MLKAENFFYCGNCNRVSYRLDCCGNITCSGGGCDNPNCKVVWQEAEIAIYKGEHPSIENMEHTSEDHLGDMLNSLVLEEPVVSKQETYRLGIAAFDPRRIVLTEK